ncbi:MAG: hypothetical protein ABL933_12925 [Methyloglobulus sp.]|nr:hypothetical protein [Methyloglobulus sp.]
MDLTNHQSTVCKNNFDDNGYVISQQCETSTQAAVISSAPLLSTWTPGTLASLQLPSSLKIDPIGAGAKLVLPSALNGSGGSWVQVPLTMPTAIKGKGFLIDTVNIKYTTPVKLVDGYYYERAIVDKIDIWDGDKKIFGKSIVPWPGVTNLESGGTVDIDYGFWAGEGGNLRQDIPIPGNIKITRGLNVSLHVVNQCTANTVCSKQSMVIDSVGAGFSPVP